MKAKKIVSGIIIIGMTFGLTGISFAGKKAERRNNDRQAVKVDKHQNRQIAVKKVDNRQDRQADRIYQGIKTGKITNREYKSLMREQARIEHAEKRAKRDGRISKREQKKLNWMQKKASDNIYEAKHNRRVARDITRYQSKNHYFRD